MTGDKGPTMITATSDNDIASEGGISDRKGANIVGQGLMHLVKCFCNGRMILMIGGALNHVKEGQCDWRRVSLIGRRFM